MTVLNPDGGVRADANDESLVLRLDWRGVSLLLTGDLGWEGEERMRDAGRAAARHDAQGGVIMAAASLRARRFLDAARPALAIISAGARNPFRHPAPEALARLEAAGARVYRTDRDGAVIVETDGVRLWVTRWAGGIREVFDLDPEPHGLGI